MNYSEKKTATVGPCGVEVATGVLKMVPLPAPPNDTISLPGAAIHRMPAFWLSEIDKSGCAITPVACTVV
jgi:hypothetical protein